MKRINNIEVRWVNQSTSKPPYLEIVKWDEDPKGEPFCYTLVYWIKNGDGWNAKLVGNRPFEYESSPLLFALMRYGQALLEAEYEFEKFQENGL